jgi:hypothetical protein
MGNEVFNCGVYRACQDYGVTKQAVIGPVIDLANLGVPSAIGYSMGHNIGTKGDDPKDASTLIKALNYLFIPGATGYYAGKRRGYALSEKAEKTSSLGKALVAALKRDKTSARRTKVSDFLDKYTVKEVPDVSPLTSELVNLSGVGLGGLTGAGIFGAMGGGLGHAGSKALLNKYKTLATKAPWLAKGGVGGAVLGGLTGLYTGGRLGSWLSDEYLKSIHGAKSLIRKK